MPRLTFPAPPPVFVVVDGGRGGEPLKTMTPELADLLAAFDDVATRVRARLADMERRELEMEDAVAAIHADQP